MIANRTYKVIFGCVDLTRCATSGFLYIFMACFCACKDPVYIECLFIDGFYFSRSVTYMFSAKYVVRSYPSMYKYASYMT